MKKRRIKWGNILCLVIFLITIVSFIFAMEHIEFIENNYNSFRLFWLIVFICMGMITGDLLLYEELKKTYRKGENKERIDKAIEEINKRSTKEVAKLYIEILKGDNK